MGRREAFLSTTERPSLLLIALMASALTITADAAWGQATSAGPLRDQQSRRDEPEKTGTSKIMGRVVAADSGLPLRRVTVRAVDAELRLNRRTETDAGGRYAFDQLPRGHYRLEASKTAFITVYYGQRHPFDSSKLVTVEDGRIVDDIEFRLPRGGVIAGRVLDDIGEAVPNAVVRPLAYQFVRDERQLLVSGQTAMTNDIGEFRLFGLKPGSYLVSATPGPIQASGSESATVYAPVYYPSTTSIDEAQPVTVNLAETTRDLTLVAVPTRTVHVSGTVLDSSGAPASRGSVRAAARHSALLDAGRAQIRADGTFTLTGLSPGDYVLQANVASRDGTGELGISDAALTGTDISDIVIVTRKSVTMSGHILPSPGMQSLKASSIRLTAKPMTLVSFSSSDATGSIRNDFTFVVRTPPGRVSIQATSLPAGWHLKAIYLHGADVTTSGVLVEPNRDVTGLEVELTNQSSVLTGTVTSLRGEPVTDYTVVIFSRNREKWTGVSRYLFQGLADPNGAFRIETLPADEYYAAAVRGEILMDWSNPRYLEDLSATAMSFFLADGESKSLKLVLSN